MTKVILDNFNDKTRHISDDRRTGRIDEVEGHWRLTWLLRKFHLDLEENFPESFANSFSLLKAEIDEGEFTVEEKCAKYEDFYPERYRELSSFSAVRIFS